MASKIGSKGPAISTNQVRKKKNVDFFWPVVVLCMIAVMSVSVYAGSYLGGIISDIRSVGPKIEDGGSNGEKAGKTAGPDFAGIENAGLYNYEPPELPSYKAARKAEAVVSVTKVSEKPFDPEAYARTRPLSTATGDGQKRDGAREGAAAGDGYVDSLLEDEPALGVEDREIIRNIENDAAGEKAGKPLFNADVREPLPNETVREARPLDKGQFTLENEVGDVVYRVQLGVFSDRGRASELRDQLKMKYAYTFSLEAIPTESDVFYRLQAGDFHKRAEAENAVARLTADGNQAFIVTVPR